MPKKGPPLAAKSTSLKPRVPLGSTKTQSLKHKASNTLRKDSSSKDKRKRKCNDAIERNDDNLLEIEDDVLEDELQNVEDIETSDEEWEVAINNLRKRNKKKRVQIEEHTYYKKLKWEVGMTFGIMLKFKQRRGRTISRGRGRCVGRGREIAYGRGIGREGIVTNDNASTSRATSVVDLEAVNFLSQASLGSSCLPQGSRVKSPSSTKMQLLRLWSPILCKGASELKAKLFNSFCVNYGAKQ
ncbi:hypothetical protein Cgig2_033841 [Carnegiea gigantea]|uniref:Uncharacterized protein n=1 Tax=Carnegiea gigantea TaxID=171969 RepID=A0A9Q1GYT1_9CARY|nr:hypothetical protein Cgig2_033841 [Carnegiea gigantea]